MVDKKLLLQCQLNLMLSLLAVRRKRKGSVKRKHRFWVRELFQQRAEKGAFNTLIPELKLYDREFFYRYLRMSPERFENLLQMVGPSIKKKFCPSRLPISPSERLIVTIRYLATGEAQQTQSFYFRIGRATVCNIIGETVKAIWDVLQPVYLKAPSSTDDWRRLADEFEKEWNFPNCIGAIDGKHVCIEAPANSGSAYYNYKNFHSMVLLAICDAKYCFSMVDIGSYGRDNDASIFNESYMGQAFTNNYFLLPNNRQFPTGLELPPVLVGDDIFALKPWLMKPYPGKNLSFEERIFNYRLSRARRTIENTFGVMAAKWRIFRRPIKAKPLKIENIIKSCVCLHNYLRLTDGARYTPSGFVDCVSNSGEIVPGDWRKDIEEGTCLDNLPRCRSNRYTHETWDIRKKFTTYFNSTEGSLTWQIDYVTSCGHNPTNVRIFNK